MFVLLTQFGLLLFLLTEGVDRSVAVAIEINRGRGVAAVAAGTARPASREDQNAEMIDMEVTAGRDQEEEERPKEEDDEEEASSSSSSTTPIGLAQVSVKTAIVDTSEAQDLPEPSTKGVEEYAVDFIEVGGGPAQRCLWPQHRWAEAKEGHRYDAYTRWGWLQCGSVEL